MTHNVDTLVSWLRIIVFIAAGCATAYVLAYAFFPWYRTAVGRVLMLQSIALAGTLDVNAMFRFWHPTDVLVYFWIEACLFSLIAVSSAFMVITLLRVNYLSRRRR